MKSIPKENALPFFTSDSSTILTDISIYSMNRKTEPTENEIVNTHSYPHPTKLPFNISDKTHKDIKIAAENIDK